MRDPTGGPTDRTRLQVVLNHPGEITPGYTPTIDCHTAHAQCKFVEFVARLDRKGQEVERSPRSLKVRAGRARGRRCGMGPWGRGKEGKREGGERGRGGWRAQRPKVRQRFGMRWLRPAPPPLHRRTCFHL